jgi:plastocyanin
MKNIHIIGFLVVLSFLLAIAGCGDKETEQPVQPAQPVVNETEEPELPEEGVQDVPAVTEQEAAPEEPAPAEPAAEEPAEEPAANASEKALTADNYRVVSLKDLKAYPEEMRVKVGTTVEWRNVNDNLQHIIGWNGQKRDGVKPEPIKQGESWSYTFMTPGKITWFSTARPTIQGIIYVEE